MLLYDLRGTVSALAHSRSQNHFLHLEVSHLHSENDALVAKMAGLSERLNAAMCENEVLCGKFASMDALTEDLRAELQDMRWEKKLLHTANEKLDLEYMQVEGERVRAVDEKQNLVVELREEKRRIAVEEAKLWGYVEEMEKVLALVVWGIAWFC